MFEETRTQTLGDTNSSKKLPWGFNCLKGFLPRGGDFQRGGPFGRERATSHRENVAHVSEGQWARTLRDTNRQACSRGDIGFLEHPTIDRPGYSLPVAFQALKS